jgi:hypothetical protein
VIGVFVFVLPALFSFLFLKLQAMRLCIRFRLGLLEEFVSSLLLLLLILVDLLVPAAFRVEAILVLLTFSFSPNSTNLSLGTFTLQKRN